MVIGDVKSIQDILNALMPAGDGANFYLLPFRTRAVTLHSGLGEFAFVGVLRSALCSKLGGFENACV